MKNAPRTEELGGAAGRARADGTAGRRFRGTDNPRHLRALAALLTSPMPREMLDRRAGASNSPDLIADLRSRGLEIPCARVPCIDRDGETVRRGVYHLSDGDRVLVRTWLRQRDGGRA